MTEEALSASSCQPQAARFPRRFGIGTLFVVTAVFAVVFALLRAMGTSPTVYLVVASFFATIALGQVLLFEGRHPRAASIIAGMAFLPSAYLCVAGQTAYTTGDFPETEILLNAVGTLMLCGLLAGYLGGGLLAGVFLVLDRVKGWAGGATTPIAPYPPPEDLAARR